MNKPEILSPAGDMERLKYAIAYGADAVYLAGKHFGMRAASDNFTDDELREGIAYAHARGVRSMLRSIFHRAQTNSLSWKPICKSCMNTAQMRRLSLTSA